MIMKCLYIDVPDPTYLTLDGRYRAGFLDQDTLWRYSRHPDYDLNEESVRRALAAKDDCFAILDGDTLAAYGWYSRSSPVHLSDTLKLHFDSQWAYMYRGFTHPAYRGQRLHAIGMTMALEALRARGAKGLVSFVERRNEASLKSCYRMGYRDFGMICEVRLGRFLGMRNPASPLLQRHVVVRSPGCDRFGFWLEALPPRERSRVASSAAAAFGKPSRFQ
jgi:GNAT superfamily N-acetyltransferase